MHTIGVIGTSKKEDERRLPIHPEHLSRLPEEVRKHLIFEKGYGRSFKVEDEELKALSCGIASRSELLGDLGSVIIAKPVLSDLQELKKNGLLWGYPHCAQQKEITQTAIEQRIDIDCV